MKTQSDGSSLASGECRLLGSARSNQRFLPQTSFSQTARRSARPCISVLMLLLWLSASPVLALQTTTSPPIPEPVPFSAEAQPAASPPASTSEAAGPNDLLNAELPITFHVLFSGGYQRVPMGTLASRLDSQGYSSLPQDFLTIGASVQMLAWDVMTEFEGQAGIAWPLSHPDYWLNMSANQTFFNLGYRFYPTEQLSIYPLVGLGVSILELNFVRTAVPTDFDEALVMPAQQGQLSHRAVALNLGLGVDWHWGNWGLLGLRGGIIWLPAAGAWTISASPNDRFNRRAAIANGPELGHIAPYLRLNIGF